MELVKALEDEFGIDITDDDLKAVESVGAAIELTMRLAAEGSAGVTPRASTHPGENVDIAIVGRGVVSSIAEGADAFFDALLDRRSGIVGDLDCSDLAGAPCSDFDPTVAMTPKEARRSDRYTQLAVCAAAQATAEAGLPGDIDPERVAVLMGTGVGGLLTLETECVKFHEAGRSVRAVSPLFVPMMMPNAAAGMIAIALGAHGPGFSVSSACATGSHAIGEAKRMIERGEADVVVAGGTEAGMTPLCMAAFERMGALSRRGISSPFDKQRDGFVMGEGAGCLVLERGDLARARGAKIYGYVVGYGASNDAFHMTQPDETGMGATKAMTLRARGRRGGPERTSATSTPTARRRRSTTRSRRRRSTTSSTAARRRSRARSPRSGTCSARPARSRRSRCSCALERGILPPTLNFEEPDPECDLDYVPDGPREAPGLELALSNSFGFGGQNACLAIRKA